MRNYKLDNIKISMMFLVIFGHLIEPLILQSSTIKTVWLWIYIFHMPVFVMVAGMLSKAKYGYGFSLKQQKTILVPFFVFTIGYELFHFFLTGQVSGYGINFQPYWILWFLISLFVWRLALPMVLKLKFPILITICVAVLAGYIDPIGRFMGISRTLYFLPFFIFGHTKLPKFLTFMQTLNKFRFLLWCGLALSIFVTVNLQDAPHPLVFGSYAYKYVVGDVWYAGAYRLGLYILSFSLSLIIIGLIPDKKLGVTSKGENSLYIYVWHGFFVKGLIAVGLVGMIGSLPVYVSLWIFFLLAASLTFVLSLKSVGERTEKYLLGPIKAYLTQNAPG